MSPRPPKCVHPLDRPESTEPESLPVEEDDVLSENWSEQVWRLFELDGVLIGRWRSEVGCIRIVDQPHDEVSLILTGRVELRDEEGGTLQRGPGESMLVQRGFTGEWETQDACEKVYVIRR